MFHSWYYSGCKNKLLKIWQCELASRNSYKIATNIGISNIGIQILVSTNIGISNIGTTNIGISRNSYKYYYS